jgi:hypothetical protein
LAAIPLVAVVLALAFWPIAFILAFNLWAPSAILHETFGVHFTAFRMLSRTYFFIRNAHFYTLVYGYTPSIITDTVFSSWPEFDKFQVYTLLVHGIQGILISTILIHALRSELMPRQKFALMCQAFVPPFLCGTFISPIAFNYHMMESVLYLLASYKLLSRLSRPESRPLAWAAVSGFLCALAFGSKLSCLLTIGPFFLLLAIPAAPTYRAKVAAAGIFLATFCASTFTLLMAYLQFHLGYLRPFLSELYRLHTGGEYHPQQTPLAVSLRDWYAPSDIFQNLVLVWAVATTAVAYVAAKAPSRLLRGYFGATGLVAAFFVYFLAKRCAPNTFIDAFLFMTFGITLAYAILPPARGWRILGNCSLVAFLGLGLLAALFQNPREYVRQLREATSVARTINTIFEEHSDLPIVYYTNTHQPRLAVPTVHEWALMCGFQEPLMEFHMKRYHPRVRFVQPGAGAYPEPHIMVVPEVFARDLPPGLQPDGEDINVFDLHPDLDAIRRDPRNESIQIIPVVTPASGPHGTRVTVCVARAVDAAYPAEVTDTPVPIPPTARNLALRQPARMSHPDCPASPARAVDGNTSGDPRDFSLAQTESGHHHWWEVDLGSRQPIGHIQLWNRDDVYRTRLASAYVFVSPTPFTSDDLLETKRQPGVLSFFVPGTVARPTTIRVNGVGRYVRVQVTESEYLDIAEVQIWDDN